LTATDVTRRADGRVVAATAEDHPHSTPDHLELKRSVIQVALARQGHAVGLVRAELGQSALAERPSLSTQQTTMI
jgi:hypothetical protein